jgi:hypothetical protein
MSIPGSVADVVRQHVTLEVESFVAMRVRSNRGLPSGGFGIPVSQLVRISIRFGKECPCLTSGCLQLSCERNSEWSTKLTLRSNRPTMATSVFAYWSTLARTSQTVASAGLSFSVGCPNIIGALIAMAKTY